MEDYFALIVEETMHHVNLLLGGNMPTIDEAVVSLEEACNPRSKIHYGQVIEAVASLLMRKGYGVKDLKPDAAEQSISLYFRNPDNLALLKMKTIEKFEGQFSSRIMLSDNFLNLELLHERTKETLNVDQLLDAGIGVRLTVPISLTVYQTSPRILTFKPYGSRDYRRNDVLYAQLRPKFA